MKRKGNNIGWCDITANPVTGCSFNRCDYCYARDYNDRFHWIPDFSQPHFFPSRLKEFGTKEPMIIFIDSMSDIGWWKPEWFRATYMAMRDNPQNIYLALTKNYPAISLMKRRQADICANMFPRVDVRFYIGATVTNNAQARALHYAGGADFISFEPLLERIKPELLEQLRCMWWLVGDLTKAGKPQGVTKYLWAGDMEVSGCIYSVPVFHKNSLRETMGKEFVQDFPLGWKKSEAVLV